MNTSKTIRRILAASILWAGLAAGAQPGAMFTAAPAHAASALASPVWPSAAIQHVVIHNLYMDNSWDANNPPALSRATLDDFTNKLVLSGYFSSAAQYGVADAAFTGSDQGTASCPAPGPGFGYAALSSWVLCQKHSLPSYSANGNGVNLWQVYVPVQASMHMSITWPWGSTAQVVQNCQTLGGAPWDGFHVQSLPSIFPVDVPQTFGAVFPGCNGGALAATTIAASHELIEAATDPNGLAWGTGALGGQEAGDLCANGMPSTGSFDSGRYQFAAYWSNAASACVAPGNGAFPPPPPPSPSLHVSVTPQAVPLGQPVSTEVFAQDAVTGHPVAGTVTIYNFTAQGGAYQVQERTNTPFTMTYYSHTTRTRVCDLGLHPPHCYYDTVVTDPYGSVSAPGYPLYMLTLGF